MGAAAVTVSALDLVQDELLRVEEVLQRSLVFESAWVRDLVAHLSKLGGKRLRPALVLLSGRAVGELSEEHIRLGGVVELIHLATLLHDDVLDHAQTRRRVPTLNKLYGNKVPILLGDIVYAQAFTLANEMDDRTAPRHLAGTTASLCTGEIEQNFTQGHLHLTEDLYLHIIYCKTASLYEACGMLGAHYAGGSEAQKKALGEYGRLLGLAFQIIDDLLDLVGDEHRVGKDLGKDVAERKLTLPLIHLVGRLRERDVKRFRAILEDPLLEDRRAALRQQFDLDEDCRYARETASDFVRQALDHLAVLEPSQEREALAGIARFVLERDL